MSRIIRNAIWYVAAMAAISVPLQATNYTITGAVKTPTGPNFGNDNIVKYIKVIARDQGVLFDTDEGSAYADGTGAFSMSFNFTILGVDANINLYMNILYEGTALDGHFVQVRTVGGTSTILDSNVEGFVHTNLPGGAHNLGILRTASVSANIITHHSDALRYARSIYAGWTQPDDLVSYAGPADGMTFVAADGTYSRIELGDYGGAAPGRYIGFANIFHETWHWIAYRVYGNRRIANLCAFPNHTNTLESCEGFAMQEGGAQYFGIESFKSLYPAGDQTTVTPSPTDWRGADNTGQLTGSDHSGEIVEGAIQRVWLLDADDPGQIRVHMTAQADTFKQWVDAYITLKGATSAAVTTLLNNAADNGIVFTRGKLTTFAEGAPPTAAPPATGNFRVIDNIAFIRGTVTPTITQLTLGETPLGRYSAIIAADKKDLGYKVAGADLLDNPTGFTFVGQVDFAASLTWNTSTIADSDYDLLVQLRNPNTWLDTFKPDFTGDVNASYNSNEKWLKTKHTWYSQEANAPTDPDKGKVIVDNTGPQANNFKPQ